MTTINYIHTPGPAEEAHAVAEERQRPSRPRPGPEYLSALVLLGLAIALYGFAVVPTALGILGLLG
jgi:hypothetical protein